MPGIMPPAAGPAIPLEALRGAIANYQPGQGQPIQPAPEIGSFGPPGTPAGLHQPGHQPGPGGPSGEHNMQPPPQPHWFGPGGVGIGSHRIGGPGADPQGDLRRKAMLGAFHGGLHG